MSRGIIVDGGSPERGSATVLGLGAVLLVLSVLVGFLLVGAAVCGSLAARAAADAAALAGAAVLVEGGEMAAACSAAADLARVNGAQLDGCDATGGSDAQVRARLRVVVTVPLPGLRGVQAQATAHAGAVPAPTE